jgi:hypothetical protein
VIEDQEGKEQFVHINQLKLANNPEIWHTKKGKMKNKARRESGMEEEQEVEIHAARPMTVRVPLVPNRPPIPRTPG